MVASQMWCLARNLPLMIGQLIPENEPHWDSFLLHLTIIDYVFAPVTSADIADYLRQLIHEHHTAFRELYPDASFIPKLHYIIHIPDWMLRLEVMSFHRIHAYLCNLCTHRCGPISRFWCMRFEAKHSYFKSLAHRVKCFKNIPKTLADRHQHLMCYILSNPTQSPFIKEMKTGKGT